MQKNKLITIAFLVTLLVCCVLSVAAAQQTPSGTGQSEETQNNMLTGMAIGIGSAIFTVGLIGVLFFRKQN